MSSMTTTSRCGAHVPKTVFATRLPVRASLLRHALCMGSLATIFISGCAKQEQGAPPPTAVSVIVAQSVPIENIAEVSGRVQAVRTAQVRARVDGIVQHRLYAEGSDVKAGQKLFAIDPRELNANLGAARAALVRAEATEAN